MIEKYKSFDIHVDQCEDGTFKTYVKASNGTIYIGLPCFKKGVTDIKLLCRAYKDNLSYFDALDFVKVIKQDLDKYLKDAF